MSLINDVSLNEVYLFLGTIVHDIKSTMKIKTILFGTF